MSIDYGNCEDEQCWYHNNTDRLNEYCEDCDFICVSNQREIDEHGRNIENMDPPFEFTLCDVCWDNSPLISHNICYHCKKIMIDPGIRLSSHEYCILCAEELTDSIDLNTIKCQYKEKHNHKHNLDEDTRCIFIQLIECTNHESHDYPTCKYSDRLLAAFKKLEDAKKQHLNDKAKLLEEKSKHIKKIFGVKYELAKRLSNCINFTLEDEADTIIKYILSSA